MSDGPTTISLQDLIRHMLDWSGMKATDVSRAMGKTSGYLAVMLYNESTPRLDLFIKIAEACGYSLELREAQDYERWDLTTVEGKAVALKDFGPEDIEEISRSQSQAHEALVDLGRKETIDALIDYLQQLRESTD